MITLYLQSAQSKSHSGRHFSPAFSSFFYHNSKKNWMNGGLAVKEASL